MVIDILKGVYWALSWYFHIVFYGLIMPISFMDSWKNYSPRKNYIPIFAFFMASMYYFHPEVFCWATGKYGCPQHSSVLDSLLGYNEPKTHTTLDAMIVMGVLGVFLYTNRIQYILSA